MRRRDSRIPRTLQIAAAFEGEKIGHIAGDIVRFRGDGSPLRSLRVGIDPVQAGTGDPSPDNVRPISGWSAANLWRTGGNLAKLSTDNAGSNQRATVTYSESGATVTATGTYGRYGWIIPVKAGNIYKISYKAVASDASNNNKLFFGSKDGAWSTVADGYLAQRTATTTETHYTDVITVPSDTLFIGLYVSALGTSGSITISDLQVELSSTPTPYAPYTGTTATIQLGQTVYGGYISVSEDGSAELVVDREEVDLGTLGWIRNASRQNFYAAVSGSKGTPQQEVETAICSAYHGGTYGQANGTNNRVNGAFCIASTTHIIYLNDERYADESDPDVFKAAVNGVQLVYELATPLHYPLSSIAVTTLAGQNVMWADCGEVDVEYVADNGVEGGKLALLLRNRPELLIAMRKGGSPQELLLAMGSRGDARPSITPVRPGLETKDDEEELRKW